jgi:GNAT superfamily N-acetyltransferase
VLEDSNLGRAWVARLYGEPAGYLLAVYVFSLEHQGLTAEIDEFFVLPPHRGLGLGHQILSIAEAQFRLEGCTNVSLQLGRSNEAARNFYRRHGFDDRAGYELVSKNLK